MSPCAEGRGVGALSVLKTVSWLSYGEKRSVKGFSVFIISCRNLETVVELSLSTYRKVHFVMDAPHLFQKPPMLLEQDFDFAHHCMRCADEPASQRLPGWYQKTLQAKDSGDL